MMKTAQTTKTKLREKHDRAKLHSSLQLDPHSRTGRFRSGFERHVAIDLKFEFKLRIPGSIAISSSFPRRSTPALRSLRFSAPIRWERFKKNAPTKKKFFCCQQAPIQRASSALRAFRAFLCTREAPVLFCFLPDLNQRLRGLGFLPVTARSLRIL